MAMKRWIWIPAMAPVMWALWRLVASADRLFAWQYSDKYAPPTTADYTRAAITFWGALLTPVVVGSVAAVVAFRRKRPAHWSIPETCIAAIPLLALVLGICWPSCLGSGWLGRLLEVVLFAAQFLLGGVIVMALLNLGACARRREWGKLVLSVLVSGGGMLYLLWWYAFIIYIDS
jgi:hypothetical protein